MSETHFRQAQAKNWDVVRSFRCYKLCKQPYLICTFFTLKYIRNSIPQHNISRRVFSLLRLSTISLKTVYANNHLFLPVNIISCSTFKCFFLFPVHYLCHKHSQLASWKLLLAKSLLGSCWRHNTLEKCFIFSILQFMKIFLPFIPKITFNWPITLIHFCDLR